VQEVRRPGVRGSRALVPDVRTCVGGLNRQSDSTSIQALSLALSPSAPTTSRQTPFSVVGVLTSIHSHQSPYHTPQLAQSGKPSLRPRYYCACAPLAGDGEVGRQRHRGALIFIRQLLRYPAILGECKTLFYIDVVAAMSPIPSHRSSR